MMKKTLIGLAALVLLAPAALGGTTHNQVTQEHSGSLDETTFVLYNSQWTTGTTNAVDILVNEPAGTALPAFRVVTTVLFNATACPNGEYVDNNCGNTNANYIYHATGAGSCEWLADIDDSGSPTMYNGTQGGRSADINDFLHADYELFGDGLVWAGLYHVQGSMTMITTTSATPPDANRFASPEVWLDATDTDFFAKTTMSGMDCHANDLNLNPVNLDWSGEISDTTRYNIV